MRETQQAKIYRYCKEHGSITNREATVYLDINSPTKRISEMRNNGYIVKTFEERKTNAEGENVRFNRYFISRGDS